MATIIYNAQQPFVRCAALIFLDDKHISNTYCMREQGHPDEQVKGFSGGHNIVNAPPAPEEKKDAA